MGLDLGEAQFLWLEFDQGSTPVIPEEPLTFAYEITGRVVIHEDDDDPDRPSVVGQFRLFYIDADAVLNGKYCSYFEVMDGRSETVGYYEHLYGRDGGISEALEELLDGPSIPQNALILDRLTLLPKYRGKRYGILILRRLIERFRADVGIVAMKPFPLQFEAVHDHDGWRAQLSLEQFTKNQAEAVAKLRWYYGALGFKLLPGTEFMFLSNELALPTPAELLTRLNPKAPSHRKKN